MPAALFISLLNMKYSRKIRGYRVHKLPKRDGEYFRQMIRQERKEKTRKEKDAVYKTRSDHILRFYRLFLMTNCLFYFAHTSKKAFIHCKNKKQNEKVGINPRWRSKFTSYFL